MRSYLKHNFVKILKSPTSGSLYSFLKKRFRIGNSATLQGNGIEKSVAYDLKTSNYRKFKTESTRVEINICHESTPSEIDFGYD